VNIYELFMLNKLIADSSLTRLTEIEIINRNTVIKSIIAATVGLLMSSAPTRAISLVQNTNQALTVAQVNHRPNAPRETRETRSPTSWRSRGSEYARFS
jgi:hypothetical protein